MKPNHPKLNETVERIIQHLELESRLLDSLIQSSERVHDLLASTTDPDASGREHSGAPAEFPTEVESASAIASKDEPTTHSGTIPMSYKFERNELTRRELETLQASIEANARPVQQARKMWNGLLQQLSQQSGQTLTVSRLAGLVPEELATPLLALRDEIRDKLNQFHSITSGNQIVLVYNLDFYGRMLGGNQQQREYYNANGQSAPTSAPVASFLRTNC